MTQRVVSLFSGIAGLELGLNEGGFQTELFCEVDPAAAAVLRARFPETPLHDDVRTLKNLPACDILTAGFPCQDLSLAGDKAGLEGSRSGLVSQIFRLLESSQPKPNWLVLENVPYMLILNRGRAMASLVQDLEDAGYAWAYRVVDARSFGLPQRRRRVLLLASRSEDPRSVLFADDSTHVPSEARPSKVSIGSAYGFYWTMGKMGAGWALESTPPIKGGSGLGIPSPPAIWLSDRNFVGTPQIEDAERLQGFEPDWTAPAIEAGFRPSSRWRLIGNAVCPPMSRWLGRRMIAPGQFDDSRNLTNQFERWPKAAWGRRGDRFQVDVSEWPEESSTLNLERFLNRPLKPLSYKAAKGFYSRACQSKEIAWADEFLQSLEMYISDMGLKGLVPA